jgi:hypothetical protein
MEAGQAHLFRGRVPSAREVAALELRALRPGKDESIRTRTREGTEVFGHVREQEVRNGEHPLASLRLGRTSDERAVFEFYDTGPDSKGFPVDVDRTACQRRQLAQRREQKTASRMSSR